MKPGISSLPMHVSFGSRSKRRVLSPASLALVVVSLVGAGCHTVNVRSGVEPHADFSRYHTFNFAEPSNSPDHPHLTQTNRLRIQSAVVQELAKRACLQADQPDLFFYIDFATSVETYDKSNPTVQGGSIGANLSAHYGLLYDDKLGSQPVVNYTEGTLSFRAVDTKQNRLVWEGVAKGALYQDRPDDLVQKRIREAVQAVFAKYPVKPGRV